MPTITAALARAGQDDFSIETVRLDEPRPDEVLVRILAVGVCHTDLAFKQGVSAGAPAVLGHEGAGVVERVGRMVKSVKPGDRVGLTFVSCGACARCAAGQPAYCERFVPLNFAGARTDGSKTIHASDADAVFGNFFGQSSFANMALAYEKNIIRLPDDMPIELAAPLGCGVQTGAGAIMNSLACTAGSSLLVVGGGSVGLSAVMAGVVQGCSRIILVEPYAQRRDLALELGASDVIDPAAGDVLAAIRAIAPQGVDYAFDTTGRADVFEFALTALANHGALGLVAGGGAVTLDMRALVMGGKTVKGIIEGDSQPDVFIPRLIELYQAGRFPLDRLVQVYPFADINRAVRDQHDGRCIKAVLTFEG